MILRTDHIAEIGGAMVASGTLAHVVVQEALATAPPSFSSALLGWWPVLVMAGVGLIMWGELRTRVRTLEREMQTEMQKVSKVPERLAVIETKLDLLIDTRPRRGDDAK
jgi:hypothetical protein